MGSASHSGHIRRIPGLPVLADRLIRGLEGRCGASRGQSRISCAPMRSGVESRQGFAAGDSTRDREGGPGSPGRRLTIFTKKRGTRLRARQRNRDGGRLKKRGTLGSLGTLAGDRALGGLGRSGECGDQERSERGKSGCGRRRRPHGTQVFETDDEGRDEPGH